MRFRSTIVAVAAVLGPAVSLGQAPGGAETKTIRAVRTDAVITLDGRLDEPAWAQAAIIEDLHEIIPDEYSAPSQRTQVHILYDSEALYLAARMYDEPGRVTANVMRQGGESWLDDQFNIYLDPFNDKRSGYRFQVNPNSVYQEGLFRGPTQVQWQWNGIWQAAASIDDEGWIAETRIPFKTLSFDPANDTWGINFNRRIARSNEMLGWVSRNQLQNPAISGELTGLTGLEQGRGLDVVTSVTAVEQQRFSPGSTTSDVEPSLDVFYKLTPALDASLTVNTDFSATEVDDRQINLTRFGLFFPEQRGFFLQNSDIFEFGRLGLREQGSPFSRPLEENARPYFSRKIGLSDTGQPVDLEVGGKLAGRVGRWNLGALAIRQDQFGDVNATDLFVGRISANVLDESSVGVIVTEGDPQSNRDNSLVGFDFLYQNSRLPGGRMLESELWLQQSDTEGLDGNDRSWGARVWMPNSTGLRGGVGVKEVERNFNPALGFVNRSDIRDTIGELGYTYRPTGRMLRSVYTGATLQRIDRLGGGLQSEVARFRVNLENQSGDVLRFAYQNEKEGLLAPFEISAGVIIPAGDYSFDQLIVSLNTGPQRRVVGNLTIGSGDFYDGRRDNVAADIEFKPTPRFRAFLGYDYNEVSLPAGDFELRLARVGIDFAYSSRLSWTNLVQYDNATETAGFNSRFHWRPEAGRDLFVVLNHSLEDRDRDNDFRSSFADLSVKFNYTFRF